MNSNWKVKLIEDIDFSIGDGNYSSKYPKISEFKSDGIPFFSARDIKNGRLSLSSVRYISAELHSSLKKGHLKKDDVLIVTRGSCGETALVDSQFEDTNINAQLVFIRQGKEVTGKYLYYYLNHFCSSRHIGAFITGSVQPQLPIKNLKKIPIRIPSLLIQKKIAHILSTLDDKIELNRKMNQTIEDMAQALFKSWFMDFDPVHAKANASSNADYDQIAKELGISREILDLFPDEFEESELGMIPRWWEVKKFGDIVTPKKGKSITKKTIREGDIPVVAGGLSPAYYHNTFNASYPVITISASGANAGFLRLYNQNIWASDCSYINSTNSDYVFTHYTYLKLKQSEITWMQQGAAQPHIYPSHLMRLDIVDAGTKLWDDFENLLTPMFKKIAVNETETQILEKTRDTLLPKLLSGELDVSELELDHVAH